MCKQLLCLFPNFIIAPKTNSVPIKCNSLLTCLFPGKLWFRFLWIYLFKLFYTNEGPIIVVLCVCLISPILFSEFCDVVMCVNIFSLFEVEYSVHRYHILMIYSSNGINGHEIFSSFDCYKWCCNEHWHTSTCWVLISNHFAHTPMKELLGLTVKWCLGFVELKAVHCF